MKHRISIDKSTHDMLAGITACFDAPCIVGAPRLARELIGLNLDVTAFTEEIEFAGLPRFRKWSLAKPVYVTEAFDFVLVAAEDVEPPELFSALRVLSHFHYDMPALILAPKEAASRFEKALDRFDVRVRETAGDVAVLSNFELP